MTTTETWTVGRLLDWTRKFLADHGADSPRLDAEVLLAAARGCKRIDLYTAYTEVPSDDVRTRFRELVRQRAAGTPVAYLVGTREFYSLEFRVTPDVLIPRPETEFVILQLLDDARARRAEAPTPRIADVGTGSGILAIVAARELPSAEVIALDISPPALAVARENAQRHGVAARIEFHQGDLLSMLPETPSLDYVLSNPPYVRTVEMATLAPEVRDHEPHLALEAGPAGTEVIERLLAQTVPRLKPGGLWICEISPQLAQPAQELVASHSALEWLPLRKDLAGLARVVTARRKA